MPLYEDLTPEAIFVAKKLAGECAESFLDTTVFGNLSGCLRCNVMDRAMIRERILTPYDSLLIFYSQYAFVKRGKDRLTLSRAAASALKRAASPENYQELLNEPNGLRLWDCFLAACSDMQCKSSEDLNRGVIQGMLELSQEIFREDGVGSLTQWIVQTATSTHRIEPLFDRIVDIRGIGPKVASTFLRDMALIFELEPGIEKVDRLYLQPIDRWVRAFACKLVPELGDSHSAPDWVIAGKIARLSRMVEVQGARLNIGCTAFGLSDVHDPSQIDQAIESLLSTANQY